jgi:hypothetical protein
VITSKQTISFVSLRDGEQARELLSIAAITIELEKLPYLVLTLPLYPFWERIQRSPIHSYTLKPMLVR